MYQKTLILFILIILFVSSVFNQTFGQSTKDSTSISKNTVYFELLGNGGLYSINYDRVLITKNLLKATFRVGLSDWYPYMYQIHFITFPTEISLLYGNKHNIEFGAGYTFLFLYNQKSKLISSTDFLLSTPLLRLSYRFQKPRGGFFLKIGISVPFTLFTGNRNKYYNDFFAPSSDPFPGLSFGYTFKN